MLIIHIKFKCALNLQQCHCEQQKKLKQYPSSIEKRLHDSGKKFFTSLTNEWSSYAALTVLSSYGLMSVKMSTPIHVETLLIHQLKPSLSFSYKRSAKSQQKCLVRINWLCKIYGKNILYFSIQELLHIFYVKLANFFLKGSDGIYFRPCLCLCHNYSALPLQQESSHHPIMICK